MDGPRWQHASCCWRRASIASLPRLPPSPPSCSSLLAVSAHQRLPCAAFFLAYFTPLALQSTSLGRYGYSPSPSSPPRGMFASSRRSISFSARRGCSRGNCSPFKPFMKKHSRFTRLTRLQPCALLFTSTSRSQATSSTSPTPCRCSRRAASRPVPRAYSISTPRASSVSAFRTRRSGTWTSSSGRWSTRNTCEPPPRLCSAPRDCDALQGARVAACFQRKNETQKL